MCKRALKTMVLKLKLTLPISEQSRDSGKIVGQAEIE